MNYKFHFPSIKHSKKKILILGIIAVAFFIIGIFFLLKKQSVKYYLLLQGGTDIVIYQNSDYVEPGYYAYDDLGNDFTNQVIITGKVNSEIAGEYLIKYQFNDLEKERKVTVIPKINELTRLVLLGDKIIYLQKGEEYVEPGYNVIDSVDYNLVDKVTITGNVDSNTPGTYQLLYSVINSRGEVITETRTVIVITLNYTLSLEDNREFVKENNFIFTTTDNNYNYILLPNGQKDNSKYVKYRVTSNGKYTFKIYNQLDNYEEKTISITNIDQKMPTGSCLGYMYDNYTELSVTAQDDTGISSYEYLYGNNTSGKITNKTYKYTNNINTAQVNISDYVNNNKTITCQMIDKSTPAKTSYKSYDYYDSMTGRTMNYWLYLPDNLTTRNSVPLLVYMHGDGGRGTNINLVNSYSFPSFVSKGEKYPFMLLAPQIGKDTNWTDERTYKTLMNLINKITAEYNINTKKIILAGGSSGGGGVYVITAAYPNFFSCSVVGSGIYDSVYRKIANNLIQTPMWIFHGTADANISYSSVKSFAEYINSIGGNVKFIGIEGGTHGVTETTDGFRNSELLTWMLSQERK